MQKKIRFKKNCDEKKERKKLINEEINFVPKNWFVMTQINSYPVCVQAVWEHFSLWMNK